MLKLILGRAGSGKTGKLYDALRQRVADREPDSLLIVPEQYSHAAERELVQCCRDAASLYAEVLSFTRLAARVLDELGGGAEVILDNGGRVLTMHLAVRAVSSRLRLYGAMGSRPEFLTSLLGTIDEMKSSAVSPEQLADAALWAQGSFRDKLMDLSYISGAYDSFSGRRDPRDLLTRLADSIGKSSFVHKTIFVDGFADFTPQEAAVLRQFLVAGADMTVALTCGGLEDDNELFRPAVTTAARLRRWADEQGVHVETEVLEPSGSRPAELTAVESLLFSPEPPPPPPQPDSVELYCASSPLEECELAAARIRSLVMDEGYRYRDIAVSARGFEDYESAAENSLSRYDIPVYCARKTNILEKPILLLITSALDILEGAWRYEPVFRYLRTGLAGVTQQEADILDSYVQKWNIYGGMWTRKADWKENPAGYDADFKEGDAQLLSEINTLRRRVSAPLMHLESAGRKAKTAAGQAVALYDFLEEIDLPQTLAAKTARFRETGRETLAAEYSQIWDILVTALEQTHAILGDSPMDQREFSSLIRLVLSQYSVATIPQTLDRVQLGDMDRSRRRDLKCLIVLGATDTRLPAPGADRGVLTRDERYTLRQLGLNLGDTSDESLYREMALIYNTFASPSQRLMISYPAAGDDGSALRKSAVFARLEAILGREAVPVSSIDRTMLITAEAPAFDLALRAGQDPHDLLAAQARAYFAGDDRKNTRLREMLEQVGIGRGELSQAAAQRLFGEKLYLSASRIDNFGSCHFRYFLQYGLKAKPRRRAEFDAPAAGTFMHYILENVSREIMDAGGFHSPAAKNWKSLTDIYISKYTEAYLGDMSEKTQRFTYLFRRLRRDVYQVMEDMVEELSRSSFVPLDFELQFGGGGELPAAEISGGGVDMALHGAVDRVDGWLRDGKLYLRVVDYKTGHKKFRLSDIWYGMGMQMLLYLFTLVGEGGPHYKNLPLEPAGVLYAPARDVIIPMERNSTREEIEKARRKELTRSGLIIRDPELIEAMEQGEDTRFIPVKFGKDGQPKGDSLVTYEQLGQMGRHINRTLQAIGEEMRSGDISARPHFGSISPPCDYCDYRMACHYDADIDGARYLPPLTRDEVLEKLQKEDTDG